MVFISNQCWDTPFFLKQGKQATSHVNEMSVTFNVTQTWNKTSAYIGDDDPLREKLFDDDDNLVE